MTSRPANGAAALLVAVLSSASVATYAADARGEVLFVGPECRIRARGPLGCAPLTELRVARGELAAVQVVLDATGAAAPRTFATAVTADLDLRFPVERQLFVPVRARSRGRSPAGDALPWTAAARPEDGSVLGEVADILTPDVPPTIVVPAGRREALWVTVHGRVGAPSPSVHGRIAVGDGSAALPVEVLDVTLPESTPVSVFAYLEKDELARLPPPDPSGDQGRARRLAELLHDHGVQAVDRATNVEELTVLQSNRGHRISEDRRQLPRDLAVLGAYGTLGEPDAEALRDVEAMVERIGEPIEDIVLYAVDEDCRSDLAPRWRERLRTSPATAERVSVMVTCSEDPTTVDADVVLTTAERFRPALADAARAQGKEVWVYNGRLPQASTMALDAWPESMTHLGWIAARYDVRSWFLWNVNHWSDRNRGGHGPRDLFADPESFHNADGDAVLYDGVLVFPARPDDRSTTGVLRSVRLARLHRGLEDARLLAAVAVVAPDVARRAVLEVVPRALGDVADDEARVLGDGPTIAAARAMLHQALAAHPGRHFRSSEMLPALVALRADLAWRQALLPAKESPAAAPRRSRRDLVALTVVASCLGGAAIAAWRLARRRRRRARVAR